MNEASLPITAWLVETLRAGQAARFVVRGWSMHPFIQDRDVVEMSPCVASDLRRGDIGVYLVGEEVIVHRFLKRDAGGYHFCGDACAEKDDPVEAEQILGVVVAVSGGGWLTHPQNVWARGAGAALTYFYPLIRQMRVIRRWSRLRTGAAAPPLGEATRSRDRALLVTILKSLPSPDIPSGICLESNACPPLPEHPDQPIDPDVASLLPMLAYLMQTGDLTLPQAWTTEAEMFAMTALHRSAQVEAMLHHLSDTLAQTGTDLLLVKGAAHAIQGTYPQPHLRPAADIDTLCRPGMQERVVAALMEGGYREAEPEQPASYYFRFRSEIALRAPESHWPALEIHWQACGRAYYNKGLPLANVWAHATPLVGFPHLYVLSPEMELVFSIAHLTKHMHDLRPIWALDMALLTRRGLNWETVSDMLEAAHLQWPAWMVFVWASSRMEGVIPDDAIRRMRAGCRGGWRRWIEMQVLLSKRERVIQLLEALCLPTWRARAGGVWRQFFPERHVLERLYADTPDAPSWRLHLRRWRDLLLGR